MLPWLERINAISVNPDMATRDDIAKMATELSGYNLSGKKETGNCEGCEALRGRNCLIATNHCIRRAEDHFKKGQNENNIRNNRC